MESLYLELIRPFISNLIPNSNVTYRKISLSQFNIETSGIKAVTYSHIGKKILFEKNFSNRVTIYFESVSGSNGFKIEVSRKELSFSDFEYYLLKQLPQAIRHTMITSTDSRVYTPESYSASSAFPLLYTSQILRSIHKGHIGGPIRYIQLLQNLSFQKYEMTSCTSGFVCVKSIDDFSKILMNNDDYTYIPFDKPIGINSSYFSSPASYRYVDGRNSFYLCTRQQDSYGIISINKPEKYNIIDRCSGKLACDIVSLSYVKWVAYIGMNNDVIVYNKEKSQLRWIDNMWHSRELSLLEHVIVEKTGCNREFASIISKVLFTLSEFHMGSLVIIGDKTIPTSGYIDNSELGKQLYSTFKSKDYKYLVSTNKILGLLSSDGLTRFDTNGFIKQCGEIITLGKLTKPISGGGRTHAACTASNYGLAIKVSEDGPISLYVDEECILKIY